MKKVLIAVVMGSDSDLLVMKETVTVLEEFGVTYEMNILSAHRSPTLVHDYASSLAKRGIKVIIAGAGGAAHLAGVLASLYPLPVIGVPMKTPTLNGVDSLYSTVQMPPGVPVATVGIGSAQNAGLLAIQILAVDDSNLMKKLIHYKHQLEKKVLEKAKKLENLGVNDYLNQIKQ